MWFPKPFLVGLTWGEPTCGGGLYVDINEPQEERMKKPLVFLIKAFFTLNIFEEVYSEPCQTFKMETFAKIVNGLKPLYVFAKNFILDVWQDS